MRRSRSLSNNSWKNARRLAVQIEQPPLAPCAAAAPRAILSSRICTPARPASCAPRHERQVLVVPNERDRVPTLATAEAMKRLPRRIHVKRRVFSWWNGQFARNCEPARFTAIRPYQLDDFRRVRPARCVFLGNLGHGVRCAPPYRRAPIRQSRKPENQENPPASTQCLPAPDCTLFSARPLPIGTATHLQRA